MTVFWRYWLLQIPGWGVLAALLWAGHRWFSLPTTVCVLVLVGWLVKDIVLFPILRPHYHFHERDAHERLLGEEAIAQEELRPRGYVKLKGELWLAELEGSKESASVGQTVVVESVDGLKLKVSVRR